MPLPISALYAAGLALVGLGLMQHVGRHRLRVGVSLGDGGDPGLLAAMRCQANYIEQVPMALILIVLVEANGAAAWWVHMLGAILLVSRIIHPFGLDAEDMSKKARLIGAVGSLAVTVLAAGTLVWGVIAG